ncbi:MAG: membrane protein insertion efficiency factor YidD [Gemmataceae bacterium]|nr:membrane protein insertion efficiency factor YidD [Gemmataceae bacterium]
MPTVLRLDALARAVLLAAVRFYRRHLSGRGPLGRLRCTFSGLESCSAYAERMTQEAPSALAAVRCVVRRLVRCRDLSLYRLEEGTLGWGRGYDSLLAAPSPAARMHTLEDALLSDGEIAGVRAAVGRAAAQVATAAGVLPPRGRPAGPALLVRDAGTVRRALRWRLRSRAVVAVSAAGLAGSAAVAGWGLLPVALSLAVTALATASAVASGRLLQRLERCAILAALEGPSSDSPAASPE